MTACPTCGQPVRVEPSEEKIAAASFDRVAFANGWYNADEIHNSINMMPLRHTVPRDVRSKEFAEWLCEQYKYAMLKGMQVMAEKCRGGE